MSRDSLLDALQAAVDRSDYDRARALFEELQLRHPNTAAEILVRLSLTDDDATAIGAA